MAKAKPTLYEQYIARSRTEKPTWHSSPSIRWGAIVASILVATFCMPSVSGLIVNSPVGSVPTVGFRWNGAPVIAERTFSVLKPAAVYQAECQQAREHAEPVYLAPMQTTYVAALRAAFDSLLPRSLPLRVRKMLLSEYAWWADSLQLAHMVVVDTVVTSKAPTVLLVVSGNVYQRVPVSALTTPVQIAAHLQQFMQRLNLADTVALRLISLVSTLPRGRFSAERTQTEQELAAAQVPRTYGIVRRGETIVAPGELITNTVAARLAAYYQTASIQLTPERAVRGFLSALVRAMLLCGIVWLYLTRTRTPQHNDNPAVVTVAALLALTNVQSWLSTLLPSSLAPEFLVLMPAAVMLVTVLYDIRLAFVFATSAALLHVAIRSSDVASGITLLVASIAGAFSVRSLQSRYQFIRAVLLVALGFGVSLFVALLESEITLGMLTQPAVAALANAISSPLLVYAVLMIADRVFDVPTDLRLFDLDSLTHPLLVKLRQIAPGTYQHTLNVANLAEHAAIAIGANPLLARVGAYFHDIGKMRKPEYFAENQIEVANKHRELSPVRSAAIIRSHVEEGIELAMEYQLPMKVIEFIPMHHGTSLIRHFYATALEEAQTTNTTVNQDDFRYPGPKPQTKETAIVMLADVAEAIARTVDYPSLIEERLEDVFREKISDGQLDECPLTLNEIATIRRLFADLITGMLHSRPEYKVPTPQGSTTSAEE
jgi:putative nucleotidyltransferase with HDIG domain